MFYRVLSCLAHTFKKVFGIILFKDVFDKDVFQNDFMGTVSLSVDEVKDASKVNLLFLLYLFVLLHAKWAINSLVPSPNKSN